MSRLHLPIFFAVTLALAPGGAAAQINNLELPEVSDSAREEIVSFIASYYDAFSDRNWSRFANHFWRDATLATVWQAPGETEESVLVTTVDDFVAQAPQGPGSRKIFEESMTAVRVVGASTGLVAVVARYRARFGDPGEVHEWEGTDLFTVMRHDEEWRIVSIAYVSD